MDFYQSIQDTANKFGMSLNNERQFKFVMRNLPFRTYCHFYYKAQRIGVFKTIQEIKQRLKIKH